MSIFSFDILFYIIKKTMNQRIKIQIDQFVSRNTVFFKVFYQILSFDNIDDE